jgi:hypothetical protein
MFAACGGSDPTLMRGDGGCFYPKKDAACSTGDVSCIQGNICCEGQWKCQNGKWNLLQAACACGGADAAPTDSGYDAGYDAGPFACGGMMCTPSQYCVDQAPGIADASDSFTCTNIPAACATTPTCACVKANGACIQTAVSSCDEVSGHVTVHCMGQ